MILKKLKLVTNKKQIQNITSDELLHSILLLLFNKGVQVNLRASRLILSILKLTII